MGPRAARTCRRVSVDSRGRRGGAGRAVSFFLEGPAPGLMSSSLRIPTEMLRSWMDVLAPRTELRGAAAIAKEMEAHLAKADADGHVAVARHQLFTWGEAIAGIARRTPLGSPVQGVADDIRAVLGGRQPGAAAGSPASVPPAPGLARPGGAGWGAAPPPPPPPSYGGPSSAPPPTTYARSTMMPPGPTGGAGGIRLVPEHETHVVAGSLVREARRELLVVSPWVLGLETLAPELMRTPASVTLRIVSRRPDREDETYHRALRDLQARKADLVMSPFLHTRMIIGDGEALLLGAAGLPKPGVNVAREAAILTSDPSTVQAARDHFHRIFDEARNGPPR